jgi:hypothetical protein
MSLSSGDNPVAGQVSATTTAANLGNQNCISVVVQNDPGSSVNVLVGDANNQYLGLQAGQAITIPCSNTNKVYVKTGSSTATVNFISVS